jgi:hypothetical protein
VVDGTGVGSLTGRLVGDAAGEELAEDGVGELLNAVLPFLLVIASGLSCKMCQLFFHVIRLKEEVSTWLYM